MTKHLEGRHYRRTEGKTGCDSSVECWWNGMWKNGKPLTLMNVVLFVVLVPVLFFATPCTTSAIWWNLGVQGVDVWRNQESAYNLGASTGGLLSCTQVGGLSPGQTKFCQLYQDHMPSVSRGAQLGIRECQWQFRNRRWNCSTVDDSSVFGSVTDGANREAAFTHAILAAGVVHAVSRACKDGELDSCGCSRRVRPKALHRDWLWGGCGDNTDYGYRFAIGFVDIREKEKNYPRHSKELARMLMNIHNNEAGRRAVYSHVKIGCKCHGVSGSCSLRTCWNHLPSFRETGDRLRDRYDGASEAVFNSQGTRLVQKNRNFNKPTREDLVYIEPSRDFCERDVTTGQLGTSGRQCERGSQGVDGCDLMCCGRGYKTYSSHVNERCRCKFHWCCVVKCESCEKVLDTYTCK